MVEVVARAASNAGPEEAQFKLGAKDFLDLLLTQLQHQDPMSSMSESEFAQQLAMMFEVSAVQELSGQVNASSNQLNLMAASSLLHKTVQLGSGDSAVAGSVDAVAIDRHKAVQVLVNGQYYKLDEITGVF